MNIDPSSKGEKVNMEKWEYLTILVSCGTDVHAGVVISVNGNEKVIRHENGMIEKYYIYELLEEIGHDGWEIVAATPNSFKENKLYNWVLLAKRKK